MEKSERNRANHGIHVGVVPPPWILSTPGDPPRHFPRRIAPAQHRRLVRHWVLPIWHWRPCFPTASSSCSPKARRGRSRRPAHPAARRPAASARR
jgi:hypothetical protein